jgi:hypothetical protein
MGAPGQVEAVLAGLSAHRHLDRENALLAIEEGLKAGAWRWPPQHTSTSKQLQGMHSRSAAPLRMPPSHPFVVVLHLKSG